MAKLTVIYPEKTSIYAVSTGEIFEWENDFWIKTNKEGIVSLTRGELLPLRVFDTKDNENVLLLNKACLYPYGD